MPQNNSRRHNEQMLTCTAVWDSGTKYGCWRKMKGEQTLDNSVSTSVSLLWSKQ